MLGPFDGWVVGLLDFPIQLYNLSLGGAFVNSTTSAPIRGKQMTLRIELPGQGEIEVRAEACFAVPDFGYGVRFLELTDEASDQLNRTLDALTTARNRR